MVIKNCKLFCKSKTELFLLKFFDIEIYLKKNFCLLENSISRESLVKENSCYELTTEKSRRNKD